MSGSKQFSWWSPDPKRLYTECRIWGHGFFGFRWSKDLNMHCLINYRHMMFFHCQDCIISCVVPDILGVFVAEYIWLFAAGISLYDWNQQPHKVRTAESFCSPLERRHRRHSPTQHKKFPPVWQSRYISEVYQASHCHITYKSMFRISLNALPVLYWILLSRTHSIWPHISLLYVMNASKTLTHHLPQHELAS